MSQRWLITGSSRGLGRALAEAALAAGHRVVATARDPDVLADLVKRHGPAVRPAALDVTDPEAAARAVALAVEAFGGLTSSSTTRVTATSALSRTPRSTTSANRSTPTCLAPSS